MADSVMFEINLTMEEEIEEQYGKPITALTREECDELYMEDKNGYVDKFPLGPSPYAALENLLNSEMLNTGECNYRLFID